MGVYAIWVQVQGHTRHIADHLWMASIVVIMNMHCVITVHQTVTVNLLQQQHYYDVLLPCLYFSATQLV